MALKTKPFDIAEHLNSPEDIRDFLQEVAATGDESDFIHALSTAARAMGMTEVAKKLKTFLVARGQDDTILGVVGIEVNQTSRTIKIFSCSSKPPKERFRKAASQ